MTTAAAHGVVICFLLGMAGCAAPDRTDRAALPAPPAASETAPRHAAPRHRPPSASENRGPASSDVSREQARRLARRFVAFATDPGAGTAPKLPFAGDVRLGLGRDLLPTVAREALDRQGTWAMRPVDGFRGAVGGFNALELVREHLAQQRGTGQAFQVSVGPHPHCAAAPVPPPKVLEQHRRISLQPAPDTVTSCLGWFTVDLFLDDHGDIAAVTLDLWEP